MPNDAPEIELDVEGEFTEEHLDILAELLVDLFEAEEAQQQEPTE